jgi:hypothetical protein
VVEQLHFRVASVVVAAAMAWILLKTSWVVGEEVMQFLQLMFEEVVAEAASVILFRFLIT